MLPIVKFFISLPFLASIILLGIAINYKNYSVDDFHQISTTSFHSYVKVHNFPGRRSYQLIIEAERKKFYFTSHTAFIPEGMTFDDISKLLSESSELTVWYEFDDGNYRIRGVKTDKLDISPLRGVVFHKTEKKLCYFISLILLVIGIYVYWSNKRSNRLDWKLNYQK